MDNDKMPPLNVQRMLTFLLIFLGIVMICGPIIFGEIIFYEKWWRLADDCVAVGRCAP